MSNLISFTQLVTITVINNKLLIITEKVNLQVDPMKIVHIFAKKLYAFHFEGETHNELSKLLNEWNNREYLYHFLKANSTDIPRGEDIFTLSEKISEDANKIDDTLHEICSDESKKLNSFFKPLNNEEYRILTISEQKGRKNYLRIYALRIDDNCFVITGGAIKLTQKMQDRKHTEKELSKIKTCRNFLKVNDIVDEESFYEFLIEQS